jgi:hypothetical protein
MSVFYHNDGNRVLRISDADTFTKNIVMPNILPVRKKNIWKHCLKPPGKGFFGSGHQGKNLLYEILAFGERFVWS